MSGFFHIPRALQIYNELEEEMKAPSIEAHTASVEFVDEKYKSTVFDRMLVPGFEDAAATFVEYFLKAFCKQNAVNIGKVTLKCEDQSMVAFDMFSLGNVEAFGGKSVIVLKKSNVQHAHEIFHNKLAQAIVGGIKCKEAIILAAITKAFYVTEKDKDTELKCPFLRHMKTEGLQNANVIDGICPALESPNQEQLVSFGGEIYKQFAEKKAPAALFVEIEENYPKIQLSSLKIFNKVLRCFDNNENLSVSFEGFKVAEAGHLYL